MQQNRTWAEVLSASLRSHVGYVTVTMVGVGKTTIPRRVGVITNLNFLSTVMEYVLSNEYLCVCTYIINKLNCRVRRAVVLNRIDQGYCALTKLDKGQYMPKLSHCQCEAKTTNIFT